MKQENEIMTITQVAEYLQLSEMTTYKLVRRGKIPAFKIAQQWRIKEEDLTQYIEGLKNVEKL